MCGCLHAWCLIAAMADRFGRKELFRAGFVEQHLSRADEIPVPSALASTGGIGAMRRAHLGRALTLVPSERRNHQHLFMEFGVRAGESITFLSNLTGSLVIWDGFDSFHGLPATNMTRSKHQHSWRQGTNGPPRTHATFRTPCSLCVLSTRFVPPSQAGEYSMKGQLPRVPENVHLHSGWYSDTLPRFLDNAKLKRGVVAAAFIHLDAGKTSYS